MPSRREYPRLPLVGAGALVHRRGKVLLVRRKFPPNEEMWALPGGLVELGERVEDAVVREVQEELGISVELERLLDVASDIHLDADMEVRYHYVLVDYLARPKGTAIRLNAESSAYRWFSPAEAEHESMSENARLVIRKYDELFKRKALASKSSTGISRRRRHPRR